MPSGGHFTSESRPSTSTSGTWWPVGKPSIQQCSLRSRYTLEGVHTRGCWWWRWWRAELGGAADAAGDGVVARHAADRHAHADDLGDDHGGVTIVVDEAGYSIGDSRGRASLRRPLPTGWHRSTRASRGRVTGACSVRHQSSRRRGSQHSM